MNELTEPKQEVLEMINRKYPNGCPDCDSDKVLVLRRERFTVDPKAQTAEPKDDEIFYPYEILCGNVKPCGFITVE